MRPHGWENRLHTYIEAVRKRPFEFVEHNCALFAAGAVRAVTGVDPREVLGVRVRSLRDVAEVLQQYGGVAGLCEAYLKTPMQAPLLARRGDVVIKPGIDGDTLGICMGTHALFLGPDGLQVRQLTECVGCWRVE